MFIKLFIYKVVHKNDALVHVIWLVRFKDE